MTVHACRMPVNNESWRLRKIDGVILARKVLLVHSELAMLKVFCQQLGCAVV